MFWMMENLLKKVNMPMPINIYYWWNFGSLLGLCLMIQIFTGLFLSFYYSNDIIYSFQSVEHIMRNVNMGWMIRFFHVNGASLFFIFIYLHIGRGLYFKSFLNLKLVWMSGVMILLLLFMIAFMGYVLPWGQMSFWGATVITNLLTSIPYIGKVMTYWLWGDFSVGKVTLMRFFSFHFIFPFIMIFFVMIHIFFLHMKGSNNPLGVESNLDKIPFNIYFILKDMMGMIICLFMFFFVCLIYPMIFMDSDNFIMSNPMITPEHIQPEWYFLYAYAILRTIPNKLGGVIALLMSIFIFLLILMIKKNLYSKISNNFIYKNIFFFWIMNFLYLTVLGGKPIEKPFIMLSMISSIFFFLFFLIYI